MSRPRVLCLIDSLQVGGTERSMLELLCRFRRLEPIVCRIYRGAALQPDYEAAGLRVISLDIDASWGLPRALRRVLSTITELEPALLHASLFRAGLLARLVGKWTGIPVVDTLVNDSYGRARYSGLSPVRSAKLHVVHGLDRATTRWVKHFVANSEAAKVAGHRALGILTDKVTVIPRGRDPARVAAAVPDDTLRERRRELGLPPQGTVLLNVARLLERKGQLELIDAFPAIESVSPGVTLLVAGDGPCRAQLERRIMQLGLETKVRLLGNRSDVPELLALADVFVFPSHWEGSPGALIEALLAGRPVVASDIPPHRELVESGSTGILVRLRDPRAITEGVTTLLRAPQLARTMGCRARESALRRYDIREIAVRYEDLLLSQLATPAGS